MVIVPFENTIAGKLDLPIKLKLGGKTSRSARIAGQRGFAGPISDVLDCAVPKKDHISISQEFTAKHPRRFCIPMGVFWIAVGIFDALTKVMAETLISGNFWVSVLHLAPPVGYTLVGIGWILIGIFKIGLSKSD